MSGRRVLLVNDDGITAPGLAILEGAARSISDDVWVVAPTTERSGASHSISLAGPLRISAIDDRHVGVDGTPADCVAMALREILDRPPDLVLAGVNRGANLADDVLYSGTCGAAREAAACGLPAIALSLTVARDGTDHWDTVREFAPALIARLAAQPPSVVVNVNFPPVPPAQVTGIEVTTVGSRPPGRLLPERAVDPRGVPYWWLRLRHDGIDFAPGTDLAAVRAGAISVSPLNPGLTHEPSLAQLRRLVRPVGSARSGCAGDAGPGRPDHEPAPRP